MATAKEHEILKILNGNLAMSGFISIFLGCLISYQLLGQIHTDQVVFWLSFLTLVNASRVIFFRHLSHNRDAVRVLLAFRGGCFLSGAAWGIAGFLFFREVDLISRVYISFTLGGLAAGAATSLSSDKYSFLAFVLPAIVPNVLSNLLYATDTSFGMAAMLSVFVLYLSYTGMNYGGTLLENIKLKEQALEKERTATRLARYDLLTDLPNRLYFQEKLDAIVEDYHNRQAQFSLLYIDLDGFKEVNDSHGHDVGDQLLVEVSKRFSHSIREEDTVARMGGDEFVIILNDIQKAEDVLVIAKEILAAVASPVSIGDHHLQISASIGFVIYPDDGETNRELLIHADYAMYAAKKNGKNQVQGYQGDG